MAKNKKPTNRKWTEGALSFAQQLVVALIRLVAAIFNLLASVWESLSDYLSDNFSDWVS